MVDDFKKERQTGGCYFGHLLYSRTQLSLKTLIKKVHSKILKFPNEPF